MEGVRGVVRTALASVLALAALLLPAAGARAVPGSDAEPPTGITVTGIGIAPAKADAADRAVRDARQRAAGIAAALRLGLGGVTRIYLPELTQFPPLGRGCDGPGSTPASCRKAVAAMVTFGVAEGASAPAEDGREVRSSGAAEVPVEPSDGNSDRSIKQAIAKARDAATREAVATAFVNAKVAAKAAGLQLGPLVSVAETPPAPYLPGPFYAPFFSDPALGTWAPGVFCGVARRPVLRRDRGTGRLKIVRVPRRRCLVPRTYETHLEIRYSAT